MERSDEPWAYCISTVHDGSLHWHGGNGRTGRILNILYLVEQGLLDIPVLYLSRYIIDHKSDYYRLLRAVTEEQEWEAWMLFMLSAVEETSAGTYRRILSIRKLLDETTALCREMLPSQIYSRELVEMIFVQPYSKISFLVDAGILKTADCSRISSAA